MGLFRIIDRSVCPCIMRTTVLGQVIEMKCVLPRWHKDKHLSPWGRWFNRLERDDNLSQMFDNPRARSATGKRKVVKL
jgi:hypothetical protein